MSLYDSQERERAQCHAHPPCGALVAPAQGALGGGGGAQGVQGGGGHCSIRVILISLFLRYPILHAPMFCHLPQGFQNCFCFCSTTFPSHVGTFFRLQWEFQWENDQNK